MSQSTSTKVRLTKKRLRALDAQLTFDDILYEKFRRLHERLQYEESRLARRKRIIKIVQQRGKMRYALQILEIHPTGDGMYILCR